jgi:hypothetical protein
MIPITNPVANSISMPPIGTAAPSDVFCFPLSGCAKVRGQFIQQMKNKARNETRRLFLKFSIDGFLFKVHDFKNSRRQKYSDFQKKYYRNNPV